MTDECASLRLFTQGPAVRPLSNVVTGRPTAPEHPHSRQKQLVLQLDWLRIADWDYAMVWAVDVRFPFRDQL